MRPASGLASWILAKPACGGLGALNSVTEGLADRVSHGEVGDLQGERGERFFTVFIFEGERPPFNFRSWKGVLEYLTSGCGVEVTIEA